MCIKYLPMTYYISISLMMCKKYLSIINDVGDILSLKYHYKKITLKPLYFIKTIKFRDYKYPMNHLRDSQFSFSKHSYFISYTIYHIKTITNTFVFKIYFSLIYYNYLFKIIDFIIRRSLNPYLK